MIIQDSYIEDLANLMNICEVPHLLIQEDWEEIASIFENMYKDKTFLSSKKKV